MGGGCPGTCLLPGAKVTFLTARRSQNGESLYMLAGFPWVNTLKKPTEKLLSFLQPGLGSPRMSLPQHSIDQAND